MNGPLELLFALPRAAHEMAQLTPERQKLRLVDFMHAFNGLIHASRG